MKLIQRKKDTSATSMTTRLFVGLGIFVCMLAAFLISQYVLIGNSIRLDESQSIWQTSHSLKGMLEIVAEDVHMPMYHVILHYWMQFFGSSVEAVRSLSLLFFLATIPFVYLLARSVLSRPWAMFVTAVFACAPFMNWYANEARMYTLLALFSIVNQYFFMRILNRKKYGWAGYAITAIVGAYSHYFFVFNLITQAIFYLLNRERFAPGTFKRFVLVAVGLLVAISPWIAYFISQGAASNTRPLIQTPTTVNFFNAFSQFLFGFQTDPVNTIIVSCWPLLVVGILFTVKRHLRVDAPTLYLISAALLPVLLAFGLSFVVTPFFLSRYMVPTIAPLFIVIAWLISRYARPAALAAATVWVAIIGVTFAQQSLSADTPVREDYRAAVQYIEKNASPSDIVVLSSPFTVYPFEYYYDGNTQIRTLPLWNRFEPGPVPSFSAERLPEEVEELKQGHEYVYLLLSYDQGYEEDIYSYFNNRHERTYSKEYSEGLTLYVYRVGYRELPKDIVINKE